MLKFRAVIPERGASINFTLQDLLEDNFSNREILWPWLKAGNQPDRFTGFTDKYNIAIYENDVIKQYGYVIKSSIRRPELFLLIKWDFYTLFRLSSIVANSNDVELLGNIHDEPELMDTHNLNNL